MKVEHKSTDNTVLPRSWWNSEEQRLEDLNGVKKLLDRQEKAWNAMLYYWGRSRPEDEVPLPSPKARVLQREEKIRTFP